MKIWFRLVEAFKSYRPEKPYDTDAEEDMDADAEEDMDADADEDEDKNF